MEKIRISKLKDLCGKYINKYINFKWIEDENVLYVFYDKTKVMEYKDISILISDYGNYIEIDSTREMEIKEAIDYIYAKYKNVVKVSFNVVKNEKKDYFNITQEFIAPTSSWNEITELTNMYYPEELGIKLR